MARAAFPAAEPSPAAVRPLVASDVPVCVAGWTFMKPHMTRRYVTAFRDLFPWSGPTPDRYWPTLLEHHVTADHGR